eukprot:1161144-Pelagomonas_calceolata.AAC.2
MDVVSNWSTGNTDSARIPDCQHAAASVLDLTNGMRVLLMEIVIKDDEDRKAMKPLTIVCRSVFNATVSHIENRI